MENKHFIIFIGIILIILMLFSLNNDDSNYDDSNTTSVEHTTDDVDLSNEQNYAPVNNSYRSNDTDTESENTYKHISTPNQDEPR